MERTTPESLDLQELLYRMVKAGIDYCVMEVSSHALSLGRVARCDFDMGVFTNISQDHLDFHQDMDEYFRAKKKLFTQLTQPVKTGPKTAIINMDDQRGREIAGHCPVSWLGMGWKGRLTYKQWQLILIPGAKFSARTRARQFPISISLTGMFSIYNAFGGGRCGHCRGYFFGINCQALAAVPGWRAVLKALMRDKTSVLLRTMPILPMGWKTFCGRPMSLYREEDSCLWLWWR